jgi:uncharacterized surface anchored protein
MRVTVSTSVCVAVLFAAPAALAATGGIAGTVTDASTTGPIANVEVDVYDSSDDVVGQVCTGSDGTYSVSPLAAGMYTVGFQPATRFCGTPLNYQTQFFDGKVSLASATPVTVAAGATRSGVDAALQVGGVIAGTVTDASSSADLGGVEVDVFDSSQNYAAFLCTKPDGTYSAPGLVPGTYTVGFQPGSGLCGAPLNYVPQFYDGQDSLASATPVMVAAAATRSGVSVALQRGGVVAGTVTDAATSDGLGGVEVDLYDSSQSFVSEVCTAPDGTYSFPRLPTGMYYVGFETTGSNCSTKGYVTQFYSGVPSGVPDLSSAMELSVTEGATKPGIDAALRGAGKIAGTVTDAVTLAGVANVGVNVSESGVLVEEVCTGAGGTYSAGGLDAGTYSVSFQPVSGCGTVTRYRDQSYNGDVMVMPGATTSGIDEALAPNGSVVTGTVKNAATGQGISGILVSVTDSTGGHFGSACTGAGGTYTISGLAAASYTVYFNPVSTNCGSAQNYVPQYYNDRSTTAAADPVTLDGSATASAVDAALQAAGTISGVVTDAASGQPIVGVPVVVSDSAGRAVTGGCTTSGGAYSIDGLAAGTYTVSFEGQLSNCGQTLHYGEQSIEDVHVSAGATTSGVDAKLLASSQGEITGAVTDAASGAALSGVAVTIYDSSGRTVGSGSVTDAFGAYSVAGLAPGGYRVGFTDGSGKHAAQFYNGSPTLAGAATVTVTGGAQTRAINAALKPVIGRLVLRSGGSLTVGGNGIVVIKLTCSGTGACSGTATLTATVAAHSPRRSVAKPLLIGTARISIAAGRNGAVRIKLKRSGRSLLTHDHGRLTAELTLAGRASGATFHLSSRVRLRGKGKL